MLIAENKNWRIRARNVEGNEEYALTMAEGRFTFYLHGKKEKIAFIKVLEKIKEMAQKSKEDLFYIAYGSYFGI